MMVSIKSLSIPRLLSSIVIRFRSIILIIFNLFMNNLVRNLTIQSYITKFVGGYLQSFIAIITGNHYSLVNVSDDDFSIGTIASQLFNQKNNDQDDTNPDVYDIFHIYLSKLVYELPERIKEQCANWGFDRESVQPFPYIQSKDLRKYTYSTQAVGIHHAESNRIIIAFRGTEPMDLLQWMTDASTNFIHIDHVFNDTNNNNSDENQIEVHAGFYFALGLSAFNPSQPIDFSKVTETSPLFLQLLQFIETFNRNDNKCQISITGHSLGAALASLFSFVLLGYGYESSISGVYTYGQPLVGNRRYAEILNNQLGNRIHRWVNHSDIVTRIPVIRLPSIAWYYARTPYSDALEVAANKKQIKSNPLDKHYYHSGLRFKIDRKGNLIRENIIDQGPILARQDGLDLFHLIYSIESGIHSLFNITPIRSFLWFIAPVEINDHFPGDYARKIKNIVTNKSIKIDTNQNTNQRQPNI